MTRYQVTAPCVVHIPTATAYGPTLETYYQDAILPDGVPQARLDHLLATGMIQAVGGPVSPSAPEPAGDGAAADSGPEGLTVNSRSSKSDLVAFGVAQGGDRAELDAKTVKELQALYLKGDGSE